ncbi:hypothetical protein AMTRI_Chr03g48930 [Amborella trichopoda]
MFGGENERLMGKKEKTVTLSVEELDTNVTTFRINEENNERILSSTWQRNLAASDSSSTHAKIVLETQDLGQIAQGTSQRMVVSIELAGNRSTVKKFKKLMIICKRNKNNN